MTEARSDATTSESIAEITEEIQHTRAALSDTVQQLAGKMDVKANLNRRAGAAKSRAAAVSGAVKESAAVLTDAVKDRATVAADTVSGRATMAGDDLAHAVGVVGDRVQSALPAQAVELISRTRDSVRRHPARWMIAAGVLLIIVVASGRRQR